jgi:hypothetical protein
MKNQANHLLMMTVMLVLLVGCRENQASVAESAPSAEQRAGAEQGVRQFMAQVAQDVTREGPLAWKKEFWGGPEFFMASDGQLAFANGPAARQGIEGVAQMIKQVDLKWGDDLRVDVLKPALAVVGTSWQEERQDAQGHHVKESGYFTAVVEQRDGKWVFRDAHWSTPAAVEKREPGR